MKILITYYTKTGNTKKLAQAIEQGVKQVEGIDCLLKPASEVTEDELISIYESLSQRLTNKWHPTLYNDFCAMKYYDWLKKLCNQWLFDKHPNLNNDLLCGGNRA